MFDKENGGKKIQPLTDTSVHGRLYFLKGEFSETDIELYKKALAYGGPINKQEENILDDLIAFLNNNPINAKFLPLEDDASFKDKCIQHIAQKTLGRNQEELFTYYEHNFLPYYKLLLKKDAGFYNDFVTDPRAIDGYWSGFWRQLPIFIRKKRFDLRLRILQSERISENNLKRLKKNVRSELKRINKLWKGSCSVKSDDFYPLFYFVTFFLTQYHRTIQHTNAYKMLEEYWRLENPEFGKKVDHKKFVTLITHFQTYRMGAGLIGDGYRIVFLECEDKSEFITSDQPIINTFASKVYRPMQNNELEYFWPLTPNLAMLLTADPAIRTEGILKVSQEQVENYNSKIWELCDRFLYSYSEFFENPDEKM